MNWLNPYLWIVAGLVLYLVLLITHRAICELPFVPYALGLCLATAIELLGFCLLRYGT